jgi:hypothetical protein
MGLAARVSLGAMRAENCSRMLLAVLVIVALALFSPGTAVAGTSTTASPVPSRGIAGAGSTSHRNKLGELL